MRRGVSTNDFNERNSPMSPTETVRTFYAALGRGDASAALTLLSDKLEWTEADGFPYFSRTWRTPQEVLERACSFRS